MRFRQAAAIVLVRLSCFATIGRICCCFFVAVFNPLRARAKYSFARSHRRPFCKFRRLRPTDCPDQPIVLFLAAASVLFHATSDLCICSCRTWVPHSYMRRRPCPRLERKIAIATTIVLDGEATRGTTLTNQKHRFSSNTTVSCLACISLIRPTFLCCTTRAKSGRGLPGGVRDFRQWLRSRGCERRR